MEGVKIIAVAYDRDPGGSMGGLVIAQKTDARIYNGMELVNRLDFDRVSAENLALQQRLTVQDQRVGELVELLTASQNAMPWVSNSELWERIHAALKPTAETEPQCLLCLDKKTVPGNIPGGFVKDCPDCCGDEG